MNENKFNGVDELVVGHSEATAFKVETRQALAATLAEQPRVDAKELHLHYSTAQLELALIRSKSRQLDRRIADLREQAAKLQAELAVKEKA